MFIKLRVQLPVVGGMIMRLLAYLALLILFSLASANSQTITAGPYNISFNPNTSKNYTIDIMPPLEENNVTTYTTLVDFPDGTRSNIIIFDMKVPVDATIETLKQITYWKELYQIAVHEFLTAYVELGTVDGKEAMIAYGELNNSKKRLLCRYFLDSKKFENSSVAAGYIEVQVVNMVPSNSTEGMDIAKSLLNTIHVEKASRPQSGAIAEAAPDQNIEDYSSAIKNKHDSDERWDLW